MHQARTDGSGRDRRVSRPFHIDESMLFFLGPADMHMSGGVDDYVDALHSLQHIGRIDDVAGPPIDVEAGEGTRVFARARENAHLFTDFQQSANDVVS